MFVIGMATAALIVPVQVAVADDETAEIEQPDQEEVVELSDAQMRKAILIADYFTPAATDEDTTADDDVDPVLETVLELRSQTGWGAVYKLMLLSEAGVVIEDLDGGWGFGKYFKNLTEAESELIADAPKNLGQLKKQQRDEAKAERKADRRNKKSG